MRVRFLLVLGLLALMACVVGPGLAQALAKESEKEKSSASKTSDEEKTAKLASIIVRGALPENQATPGLFSELQQDLPKLIARLDKAAKDDAIVGVVLRIRSVSIGFGKVGELRAAIERTRKAGKKVYALLEAASAREYLVACACDQIVMPPSGTIMLPGIRAEVSFYKGMLDKLGVQADILHMGEAKGAGEVLTRKNYSPAVKKNLTLLVDDLYDHLVATIAADRKLSERRVQELVDQGLFTVGEAEKFGLVDRVAYEDQWKDALRESLEVEKIALVPTYGKKKVKHDFSGPMGMFKLMQVMMGGKPGKAGPKGKKIAVVYAVGPITTGPSKQTAFGGRMLGSATLVKALRTAEQDESVAAIVLRINSPGGSALASDLIWREVDRIEKPVIASMGDVAASGGYYIAMAADKIYAEPATVTGSIGVVGGKVAMAGLLDKIGVTREVISRGQNSGIFSQTTKFSETERQALQAMMANTYRQFTTKAAAGRKMELANLEKLASGQVWSGTRAKRNGLVDEIGGLRDAVASAKQAAGLDPDKPAEVLILPKPKTFFDQLFRKDEEEVELSASLRLDVPGLGPALREAAVMAEMFREPVLTLMPWQVSIQTD